MYEESSVALWGAELFGVWGLGVIASRLSRGEGCSRGVIRGNTVSVKGSAHGAGAGTGAGAGAGAGAYFTKPKPKTKNRNQESENREKFCFTKVLHLFRFLGFNSRFCCVFSVLLLFDFSWFSPLSWRKLKFYCKFLKNTNISNRTRKGKLVSTDFSTKTINLNRNFLPKLTNIEDNLRSAEVRCGW